MACKNTLSSLVFLGVLLLSCSYMSSAARHLAEVVPKEEHPIMPELPKPELPPHPAMPELPKPELPHPIVPEVPKEPELPHPIVP
jgi:hypothetical protein